MRTPNPRFRKKKLGLRLLGTARAWWQVPLRNTLRWRQCGNGFKQAETLTGRLGACSLPGVGPEDALAPTALGSRSVPHTSQLCDLGQGPSLALSVILFLPSGLGVDSMISDNSEGEF